MNTQYTRVWNPRKIQKSFLPGIDYCSVLIRGPKAISLNCRPNYIKEQNYQKLSTFHAFARAPSLAPFRLGDGSFGSSLRCLLLKLVRRGGWEGMDERVAGDL